MLFLFFVTAVLASGPPVDIPDPDDCVKYFGYIPGKDFPGGDCCSFVCCDNANANKTGYLGKCMGGTAWNIEFGVCDVAKYVDDCDPETDCVVPSRTTAECPVQLTNSCCNGARPGFNGYEPSYTTDDGGATYYLTVFGSRTAVSCPLGQVFNVADCCCEFDYSGQIDPVCSDTSSYVFPFPDHDNKIEECCIFVQCWANRTGYDVISCMPPSVWNDQAKACDMPRNVLACMEVDCGPMMNDPPCIEGFAGECCIAGNYYEADPNDQSQYVIVAGPGQSDRFNCCPDGEFFNSSNDVCCCEVDDRP